MDQGFTPAAALEGAAYRGLPDLDMGPLFPMSTDAR